MFRRAVIILGFIVLPLLVNRWSLDPFELDKITLVRCMGVISFAMLLWHGRAVWSWLRTLTVRDPGFWAVLFVIWTALATVHSSYCIESFWGSMWRGGGFITLTSVVILMLALRLTALSVRTRQIVAWCASSVLFGTSVLAIAQYHFNSHLYIDIPLITTGPPFQLLRPAATFGHPLYFGIYLALTAPFLWYLWKTNPRTRVRALLLLMTTTGSVALYLSRSRSAMLAVVLSCIALLFWHHRMRIRWTWVASGAPVAIITCMLLLQSSAIRASLLRTPSLIVRVHEWQFASALLLQSPFFGYGPETYDEYAIERVRPADELKDGLADRVHNLELDIVWISGVVGLVLFALMIITALWTKNTLIDDPWTRTMIGSLVAYVVVMQFAFDFSYTYFFLAFALAQLSPTIASRNNAPLRVSVLALVLLVPILSASVAGYIGRKAELAAANGDYSREVELYAAARRIAPYWPELEDREDIARRAMEGAIDF